MLFLVKPSGLFPVLIAYCSEGRPNESKPIGCNTLYPCILFILEIISVAVYPSACPTCNPSPEVYGNISKI